jgi:CheY-like chemotaxis protein
LTRYGFETVQAANGEEAFRIFSESKAEHRLHAAVTDYLMPKSDGADLVGKIKAVCPEFPVVLVTGEAPDAVILRVAALPEVIALLKPFRPEALREALRSVLHEPLAEGRKEYRRCTRVDSAVTCTFYETSDASNQPHYASVRNLGFGGCYVQTDRKLPIGTKVRFFFQGLDRYVFAGRVVWTGNAGVGLALIPECAETVAFFKKFVLNKLKQKGVGIMGANCASEEAERAESE